MKSFLRRILFMLKHQTWKRVARCGDAASEVVVFFKGSEIKINRLCPHQGLPLDKGYFQGDDFVCPWHGCRFSLSSPGVVRPFAPALHSHKKS